MPRTKKAPPASSELDPAKINAQSKILEESLIRRQKILKDLRELEAEEEITREQLAAPTDLEAEGPDQEPSKLDRIMAEIGNDGTFDVYFIAPNGGKESKLGSFPVADYPDRLEALARAKGGGDFRATFRKPNGHHAGQFSRTFDPATYGGGKTDQGAESRLADILLQVQEAGRRDVAAANERADKMMLAMIQNRQGESAGGMGISEVFQFASMLAKANSGNGMGNFKDMLELMRSVKEEMGDSTGSPIENVLTRILSSARPLLEAGARKLAEGPPPGMGIPPVAPAAPPRPGSAPLPLQGQPLPPKPAAPAPSLNPNPPAAAPAPIPAPAGRPVPPSFDPQKMAEAEAYAPILKKAIRDGADLSAAASFAAIQADMGGKSAELLTLVSDPQIAFMVITVDPELTKDLEWLEVFFGMLRDELTEDTRPPEPPAAESAPVVTGEIVTEVPAIANGNKAQT